MTGTWDLLPIGRFHVQLSPNPESLIRHAAHAGIAALGRCGRRYPAPGAPRIDPPRPHRRHRRRGAGWMDPRHSSHGPRPRAGRAPGGAPRRCDDPLYLCEPPGAVPGDGRAARRGPGPPRPDPFQPRRGPIWLVDRAEREAAGANQPVEGGPPGALAGPLPRGGEPSRGPAPDGQRAGEDRGRPSQASGRRVFARRSHPPGPRALRRDAHRPVSPHLGGYGVGVGAGARRRHAPDPEGERHRRPLRPRAPPLAWEGAREGARIAGWTLSVSTASPRAPSGNPVSAPSTSRPVPAPSSSP